MEGLNKRSVYTGNSSKTKENSKTKVLTSKSISEAFDAIDGDVASDDSKGEVSMYAKHFYIHEIDTCMCLFVIPDPAYC